MIIAECEHCLTEYDAKRSTSRFCGPKCKQAFYRNRMKTDVTVTAAKPVTVTGAKRGKDIKCFEDLPDDVRATIDHMSRGSNGKIDHTILVNRTAIAINYQHLFPGRYYSTGAA